VQDLNDPNPKEVGMCMSIETIPDGVDYNIMTTCNGLRHYTMVAAYIDDKLDDILACLKLNKYNAVLEELFQGHMVHVRIDKEESMKQPIHMGYCRTLRSLLDYNDFMYDFRRAFGIEQINIKLSSEITEDNKLSNNAKEFLQKLYNKFILDELVIKYDKDIDLESIKKTAMMVCDCDDNIYIITYTEGKEYIENAARLNSRMSPMEKLETIFSSSQNEGELPQAPNLNL
jgi:hypothetical protein